jgi:8-oxo-dGTP pyrophosphatase MutT (NUDIX family)
VSDSSPASIPSAATVIVLRDGPGRLEVFIMRRHEATAFMGGAWVFPGGRVDAADRGSADASWCDGLERVNLTGIASADAAGFYVAAARELFEEAGVLLARDATGAFVSIAGDAAQVRFRRHRTAVHRTERTLREVVEGERLRLALDALVPYAHWITPPIDKRRFDTRFFAARVPPAQTPAPDAAETTHSIWTTAADALARARRDEILLPPPTWTTLRELERFASVNELLAWAARRRIVPRQPQYLEREGQRMMVLPGDPLRPDLEGDEPPVETRFVFSGGRWRAERPPA